MRRTTRDEEDEEEEEKDAGEEVPEEESEQETPADGRGRARRKGRGRGRARMQGRSKRSVGSPGRGTTPNGGHGKRVRVPPREPKPLDEVGVECGCADEEETDDRSPSPPLQLPPSLISPGPGTTLTSGRGTRVDDRPEVEQRGSEGRRTGWAKARAGRGWWR